MHIGRDAWNGIVQSRRHIIEIVVVIIRYFAESTAICRSLKTQLLIVAYLIDRRMGVEEFSWRWAAIEWAVRAMTGVSKLKKVDNNENKEHEASFEQLK